MQVLPVDLTAIVAIVMGISIVLVPVAGLTARFALKPTVEAFARLFEHQGLEDTVGILERRVSLLETRLESMDDALDRIARTVEFDHELSRPPRATRRLESVTTPERPAGSPETPHADPEQDPAGEERDRVASPEPGSSSEPESA